MATLIEGRLIDVELRQNQAWASKNSLALAIYALLGVNGHGQVRLLLFQLDLELA